MLEQLFLEFNFQLNSYIILYSHTNTRFIEIFAKDFSEFEYFENPVRSSLVFWAPSLLKS